MGLLGQNFSQVIGASLKASGALPGEMLGMKTAIYNLT